MNKFSKERIEGIIDHLAYTMGEDSIGIYIHGIEEQRNSKEYASETEWLQLVEDYRRNNFRLDGACYWGHPCIVSKLKVIADNWNIIYTDIAPTHDSLNSIDCLTYFRAGDCYLLSPKYQEVPQ